MDGRVEVRIINSLDGQEKQIVIPHSSNIHIDSVESSLVAVCANGSRLDLSSSRLVLSISQAEPAGSGQTDVINSNSIQTGQAGLWSRIASPVCHAGQKLFAEATIKVVLKAVLQYVVWPLLVMLYLWWKMGGLHIDAATPSNKLPPTITVYVSTPSSPHERGNPSPAQEAGLFFFSITLISIGLALRRGLYPYGCADAFA